MPGLTARGLDRSAPNSCRHRQECVVTVRNVLSPSEVCHHRQEFVVTVRSVSSPSEVCHHRQEFVVTVRSVSSPGGSPEKNNKTTISQLMPLATFVPSLGRCGQGPWLSILAQIRQFFFLVTLACLDISSKKRCLYRLFIYYFKAHTISNKLV